MRSILLAGLLLATSANFALAGETTIYNLRYGSTVWGLSSVPPLIARPDGSFLVEAISVNGFPGTVSLLLAPARPGADWTLHNAFTFTSNATGLQPNSAGIVGTDGALYGMTTYGGVFPGVGLKTNTGGVVFSLSPPAARGGVPTETILHNFAGCTVTPCDGYNPSDTLARDAGGAVYGMTNDGGTADGGTIFRLAKDDSGAWRETILANFGPQKEIYHAYRGPTLDAAGNLYGVAVYGGPADNGFVFELSPPAKSGGGWVYRDIYDFTGALDGGAPNSRLIVASPGVLYGDAYGGGAYRFAGDGGGVVYQLSQTKGGWAETVLHNFGGPGDGWGGTFDLVLGGDGSLYGTTIYGTKVSDNNGTVFRLSPPAIAGGTWQETRLAGFAYCAKAPCVAGNTPFGLTQGANGGLFGIASLGGAHNQGTVYQVTPASP